MGFESIAEEIIRLGAGCISTALQGSVKGWSERRIAPHRSAPNSAHAGGSKICNKNEKIAALYGKAVDHIFRLQAHQPGRGAA